MFIVKYFIFSFGVLLSASMFKKKSLIECNLLKKNIHTNT